MQRNNGCWLAREVGASTYMVDESEMAQVGPGIAMSIIINRSFVVLAGGP